MTDLRRHVPPLTLVWDDEAPGALHRTVDGTLVFADVSGFTALTERLSRQGRIGAEEIVEALNRVFGPMLTIAAARGGELLKFGGDALLFLFRGPDHPEQACDAAVEMRASLRAAAAVPTSAGRFSLSMSVGVHAGDIELFLVGSPTRELLVLGPGANAVARAEKAAEAGEVVVSPATAARLARNAVRARDDGALLLRRRRPHTAPRPRRHPHRPAHDPMPTLFPTALGQFLAPGPPDPEHRVATIAFVRFSGTDAVLAQQGPAALAALLHELVSTVEAAFEPPRTSRCWPPTSTPTAASSSSAPACPAPGATTRAGCCARCAGSRTPAAHCRCRCSSAWLGATSSRPRSAWPTGRRTRRWATPRTRPPGSWAPHRRARCTPSLRCSSGRAPCSR